MATKKSSLWHPMADMSVISRGVDTVIDRGEGIYVWDVDGRRYLDASASLWYMNLGHGRDEVVEAVATQLRRLDAFMVFNDYSNPPANELADRLAELSPMPGAKIMLGSGGGDGIEAAAKIARAHFVNAGRPEKTHLIGRTGGYHGSHGIGTAVGGIEPNRAGWGPLLPGVSQVPYDSLEALEAEILRVGPERVAAFFCEPVMGSTGVWLPPPGYLEGAAQLCAEHDVLLVADAVISGFGRLGTWFGIERFDVVPDMIVFAKGVSAGFLPLGGVVVSERLAAPYWDPDGPGVLRHGVTFAGHPACCAAALAALDIYERDEIIPRGRLLEGFLAEVLRPLAEHESVAEVRAGLGLLGAVDLTEAVLTRRRGAVDALQRAVRAAGAIVRPSLRGIAVCPPLVATEQDLVAIGEAIDEGLTAFEREHLATSPYVAR